LIDRLVCLGMNCADSLLVAPRRDALGQAKPHPRARRCQDLQPVLPP
jgi:hypothetical protein